MIYMDEWETIIDIWMNIMVFKLLFSAVSLWLCLKAQVNFSQVKFKVVAFTTLMCSVILWVNLGLPYKMTFYDVFHTLSYDVVVLFCWASFVGVVVFPRTSLTRTRAHTLVPR